MNRAVKDLYGRRLKLAFSHLLISIGVAALAAWLVFSLWYPYPYRIISGGRAIFFILISVDVILGPLITLFIANTKKPMNVLVKDLLVIGLLQIGALAYGMLTLFDARPVHIVFERDRFQVVHAVDIPEAELDMAPVGIKALPTNGPTLLSLRPFNNPKEEVELTMQSAMGITLAAQPSMWIPFEQGKSDVLSKARSIALLKAMFPQQTALIDRAVQESGRAESQLAFLPLVSRQAFWTVLIDTKTAKPVAYIDLDPYEVTTVK